MRHLFSDMTGFFGCGPVMVIAGIYIGGFVFFIWLAYLVIAALTKYVGS
jgi:hypothetical protein